MQKFSTRVVSNMAADRERNEGIGNDFKSKMAANRVLMFRFKTAQYLGKNSLDFWCISRRFNAQNAASTVAHKTTGQSQERSNLSQTEGEQIWAFTNSLKLQIICTFLETSTLFLTLLVIFSTWRTTLCKLLVQTHELCCMHVVSEFLRLPTDPPPSASPSQIHTIEPLSRWNTLSLTRHCLPNRTLCLTQKKSSQPSKKTPLPFIHCLSW